MVSGRVQAARLRDDLVGQAAHERRPSRAGVLPRARRRRARRDLRRPEAAHGHRPDRGRRLHRLP